MFKDDSAIRLHSVCTREAMMRWASIVSQIVTPPTLFFCFLVLIFGQPPPHKGVKSAIAHILKIWVGSKKESTGWPTKPHPAEGRRPSWVICSCSILGDLG